MVLTVWECLIIQILVIFMIRIQQFLTATNGCLGREAPEYYGSLIIKLEIIFVLLLLAMDLKVAFRAILYGRETRTILIIYLYLLVWKLENYLSSKSTAEIFFKRLRKYLTINLWFSRISDPLQCNFLKYQTELNHTLQPTRKFFRINYLQLELRSQ